MSKFSKKYEAFFVIILQILALNFPFKEDLNGIATNN